MQSPIRTLILEAYRKEVEVKPKEWLYKMGHIDKVGRGRMSADHKRLIEEALVADPTLRIEGFEVSAKPSAETAKPEIVRVKTDANRLLDVPDALRSDKDFTLVRKDTGKPMHAVGMRNVCQGCGSSFTYCPCRVPTFLDNTGIVPVEFRMKKGGV